MPRLSRHDNLIPLREVGAMLNPDRPLSMDHLRRMIRQKKLVATKVNGYWFCTKQAVGGARRNRRK